MYIAKKFLYGTNEAFTVFSQATGCPALYPLVWFARDRKNRASRTIENDMRGLAYFYDYIYMSCKISPEVLFENNGLDGLINCLSGFSCWMEMERKAVNIKPIVAGISDFNPDTHDLRIKSVCKFLIFLNDRYSSSRYLDLGRSKIMVRHANHKNKINNERNRLTNNFTLLRNNKNGSNFNKYPSFKKSEIIAIINTVIPSTVHKINDKNPWVSKDVQLRNYAMVRLLSDYGLRKGELLLLKTCSFVPLKTGGYVLIITNNTNDEDARRNRPRIKNDHSHRTISISDEIYLLLKLYVEAVRNINSIPDHDLLFVCTRHKNPLSINYPNNLCNAIYRSMKKHYPSLFDGPFFDSLNRIYPHAFRHTWAVGFLSYLIEVDKMDFKAALEQLEEVGGWTPGSNMPAHYGRRFIHDKGNSANLRRIENEYNPIDTSIVNGGWPNGR